MNKNLQTIFSLLTLTVPIGLCRAQTDNDGVMMAKNNLCSGVTYMHSAWNHYWEGTFYRENKNLGTVSMQSIMAMANYGIMKNLNLIAAAPYIMTKASAGTLSGMKGFQDVSLLAKYRFIEHDFKEYHLSAFAVVGGSTPMSKYVADYQPLALGLHSTNGIGRIMVDVEKKHFYATASWAYILRSNVKIDRTSYYTTELHYTNIIAMPNAWNANVRLGYRKDDLIMEAYLDRFNTMGGFDMRKNDMPFPSNNMEATRVGVNLKIPVPKVNGLAIVANSFYTLAGRNMGRSLMYMGGLFYVVDFSGKKGDNK